MSDAACGVRAGFQKEKKYMNEREAAEKLRDMAAERHVPQWSEQGQAVALAIEALEEREEAPGRKETQRLWNTTPEELVRKVAEYSDVRIGDEVTVEGMLGRYVIIESDEYGLSCRVSNMMDWASWFDQSAAACS